MIQAAVRLGLGIARRCSRTPVPDHSVATYLVTTTPPPRTCSAFADLAEQVRGVRRADVEAVLEVGPEAVDLAGAAIACGGEEFVEVGVRKAAHGLALQAEDTPDRAAAFPQPVHVGMTTTGAGQELVARRIHRRRCTDQGGGVRSGGRRRCREAPGAGSPGAAG